MVGSKVKFRESSEVMPHIGKTPCLLFTLLSKKFEKGQQSYLPYLPVCAQAQPTLLWFV